jgi:phosphatidylinositol kinase/protein kinase (PI-3  family)
MGGGNTPARSLMDFARVANMLFAANSESRRRGLHLRTFAVIVINEETGILQVLAWGGWAI